MLKNTYRIADAVAIVLTFGVVSAALPANAQTASNVASAESEGTLEEVVVTAERRSQDIQKTGVSVTAISGDTLEEQGRFSVEQVLKDVPGVTVNGQSFGGTITVLPRDNPAANILIRGVPAAPQPVLGTAASSTAYYVDGVYAGVGGEFDLDRVEVLRGPQGTLYGRSATSGLMAVYSRNPDLASFGFNGSLEVASQNLRRAQAAINIPLGDTFAVRVSGSHFTQDGVISAEGTRIKQQQGRIKALWKPSDDVSLLVGYTDRVDYTNSGGATARIPAGDPSGSVIVSGLPIYSATTRQQQLWAELTVNAGIGDLVYTPSYHTYETAGPVGGPLPVIIQNQEVPLDRFVTHELRLTSHADSKINWQVGAIRYQNKVHTYIAPVVIAPFGPFIRTGSIFADELVRTVTDTGLFAEATIPFGDTLRLTAGARYNKTKMDIDASSLDNTGYLFGIVDEPPPPGVINSTLNFNSTTYKLRLEKDLTIRNMAYAMISTGVLPGDAQLQRVGGGAPPIVNQLEEEKLTSYEIGSKNRFLNDTLQINGSVFYYDFAGYQQVVQTDPNIPTSFATLSTPAKMYGIELDSSYLLTRDDRLAFTYGHTKARFVDKPALFAQFVAQDDIPGVVPYLAALSYTHTFRLPGGSTLDFFGQYRVQGSGDSVTLQPSQVGDGLEPYIIQDKEELLDTNLSWASPEKRLNVTGYVNNVFDKAYRLGPQITNGVPGYQAAYAPNAPRTFGLILRYKY